MGHRKTRALGWLAMVGLALAACEPPKGDPAQSVALPPAASSSGATQRATPASAAGSVAPAGIAQVIVGAPPADRVEPPPVAPPAPPFSGATMEVVVATPTGEVRGLVRPAITFDRPVRALGSQGADDRPPATLTPAVDGTWTWLGSTTVEFAPTRPLPLATTFTVAVDPALTALDGARLATPFQFTFDTPAVRPIEGDPVTAWRAYQWVEPEQIFKVVFDQRPAPGTLEANLRIVGAAETIGVSVLGVESLAERARAEARAEGTEPKGPDAPSVAADRRVEVRFKPQKALTPATPYRLVFAAGMASAEGPRTQAKAYEWTFNTYGPLKVLAVECERWHQPCATGPMTVRLSNPVTAKALAAALEVDPSVALRWPQDEAAKSASWVLSGDFRPDKDWSVEIAGLSDVFGQAIEGPWSGVFHTGDYPAFLDTVENQALLERGHRAALPITHVNAPAVRVGVAALSGPAAAKVLEEPWSKTPPVTLEWRELALPGAKNARLRSPLDLADYVGEGVNAALVRLQWKEGRYDRSTSTFVQVTDLAVHGKISPNSIAVWVWRLSAGAAVADAEVVLLDREGKVVASGRTDATGVAQFPGVDALALPSKNKWGGPLYGPPFVAARVRHADDVAYANLRGDYRLAPYRFGVAGGWENTPPRAEGMVWTDRGIYRPGETLFVRGVLRERSLGKLRTPEGHEVTLRLEDPKGTTIETLKRVVDAFGGVDARFVLPAGGRLGSYSVGIEDPETKLTWRASARVAEYRAPAFLVDVTGPKSVIAGEAVKATVEGRYLFGAAMSGAEVSWAVLSEAATFDPPNAEGFAFGKSVAWWQHDSADREVVARGQWRLDDAGRFAVDAGEAEASPDRPRRYTVEAQVTDVDRQAGGNRARLTVHPADFYVGLRGPAGFATAGAPFDLEAVARAASADAERVAAAGVSVKLVAHQWNTVRKKNASGAFETVSEKEEVEVDACTLAIKADAKATCTLTPKAAGFHELVSEAKDAKGRLTRTRLSVWVVGPGYAAWLRDDDHQIEVVADKPEYDVGDTARLLVQSPFPQAEAWVTVEREGVLSQRRVKLEGTATPIEIPIDETMIPNVFVSVVLARGRLEPPGKVGDPGRPTFRLGYREIRVLPDQKRLAVSLKPDSERKFPGEALDIAVAVTDRAGAGVRSAVTVWAVDEGVLALTGYEAMDPVAHFQSRRPLSVRNGTNLTGLVAQHVYGDKGSPQGGGGGPDEEDDPHVRKRFVTTPIFVGSVITDAQGNARVKGTLPDNLTTFRLMAVAVTEGDRGGRGRATVVVNKPLLARPALPRVVREGDTFAAGVVIHGTSGTAMQVTVRAEVLGGGVEALGETTRTVRLPANRGVEVRFPFKATGISQAKLRFAVAGGGHTDAVQRTLPVLRPVELQTMAVFGQAGAAPRVEALALPDGLRDDVGGLTVNLASSALAGLADDAQDLIEYPYGCLEQQASRLIPVVALGGLLERSGEAWGSPVPPKVIATRAVKAIGAMQRPDGGFGYWPGARQSHYWGTAHAVLALHAAQAEGHSLEGVDLPRAIAFLRKYIDTPVAGSRRPRQLDTQAFGAWVLSRVGQPDAEIERRVFARRGQLALFGQAMLAAALGRPGGPSAKAKQVLEGLLGHARVDADRVHFAESDPQTYAPLFSSDTRTTAMGLLALLAVAPEHAYVPRLVAYLLAVRRGSGGYRTTQEGAYSLLALAEYAQKREAITPKFIARVKLAQATLVEQAFEGKALTATRETVGIEALAKAGARPSLTFAADGQGTLYYAARLRYAPKQIPQVAIDRGIMVQRWFSPEKGEGTVEAVTEGALVRVNLRLVTHQARHYVAVVDPLPAGLEPVDPRLKTTARMPGADTQTGQETLDRRAVGRWADVFDHIEVRDDRVLLFADHLAPGIHTYSYVARATTAGTFALPPAVAEEMYNPEVSGQSSGGQFWVHPRAELTQRTP